MLFLYTFSLYFLFFLYFLNNSQLFIVDLFICIKLFLFHVLSIIFYKLIVLIFFSFFFFYIVLLFISMWPRCVFFRSSIRSKCNVLMKKMCIIGKFRFFHIYIYIKKHFIGKYKFIVPFVPPEIWTWSHWNLKIW